MKTKSLVASLFVCFLLVPATSVASPVKFRTTCNGCNDLQMAETAANLGEGEYLVFNVTGQIFRKYEVFCVGSGGGGGHVRSSTRSRCSGVLNPVEQEPTPFDLSAFEQIRDALTPAGGIEKIVRACHQTVGRSRVVGYPVAQGDGIRNPDEFAVRAD